MQATLTPNGFMFKLQHRKKRLQVRRPARVQKKPAGVRAEWGFQSHRRLSLKASTPYLDTQYGPPNGLIRPNTLAMFTTRPLVDLMRGRTLRVTSITPHRLTDSICLKSSMVSQSVGPDGTEIPALFTTAQRPTATQPQLILDPLVPARDSLFGLTLFFFFKVGQV